MLKKQHAQHNEDVCRLLNRQGTCNDWVVTTAFYSGLHYVQHEMFPYNDGLKAYPSFENYYNSLSFTGKRPSRHIATIDLVHEILTDCGKSYEFLYQTCWTARYQKYQIPQSVSKKAIEHLENIKGALLK